MGIRLSDTLFQFQTGAIKRPFQILRIHYHRISFNSKLVRLKVCISSSVRSHDSSFNSKLVRLKVAPQLLHVNVSSSFQFQTGAIKSCPP